MQGWEQGMRAQAEMSNKTTKILEHQGKLAAPGGVEKPLVAMVYIDAAVAQTTGAAIKDDKRDLVWTLGVWVDCTEQ